MHLQCSGKTVCTATSTVIISTPEVAHLFLEEKYAIGQMFSRLEKVPAFQLLAVGLGPTDSRTPTGDIKGDSSGQLWRKYKLYVPGFECEILEVFPSREMFASGERWLEDNSSGPKTSSRTGSPAYTTINHAAVAGFFGLFVLDAYMLWTGRWTLPFWP